jgi:hypothetical protein
MAVTKVTSRLGRTDFAQDLVAGGGEHIRIFLGKAKRGADLQRIAVGTGGADQNASVTKLVNELAGEIKPFVISHAIRRKAQGVTFVQPGQYRQQADDTLRPIGQAMRMVSAAK